MPFTCHPSGECPGPKVPLAPKAGRFADVFWAALAVVPCVADVLSGGGEETGGVYGLEAVCPLLLAAVLVRPPVVYDAGTMLGWFAGAVWV